jgi:hypothetical protein
VLDYERGAARGTPGAGGVLELSEAATIPTVTVVGVGAIWTVNDRFAIFGSYNFGLTRGSPRTIALLGGAVAF